MPLHRAIYVSDAVGGAATSLLVLAEILGASDRNNRRDGLTGVLMRHDGRFLQRYLNKGVMTEQLERVPVWRVEHGQLGLLGAVAWYRQNRKA